MIMHVHFILFQAFLFLPPHTPSSLISSTNVVLRFFLVIFFIFFCCIQNKAIHLDVYSNQLAFLSLIYFVYQLYSPTQFHFLQYLSVQYPVVSFRSTFQSFPVDMSLSITSMVEIAAPYCAKRFRHTSSIIFPLVTHPIFQ